MGTNIVLVEGEASKKPHFRAAGSRGAIRPPAGRLSGGAEELINMVFSTPRPFGDGGFRAPIPRIGGKMKRARDQIISGRRRSR